LTDFRPKPAARWCSQAAWQVLDSGTSRDLRAHSKYTRFTRPWQAYLPNIADSEVLNEVSRIVLKIDFVLVITRPFDAGYDGPLQVRSEPLFSPDLHPISTRFTPEFDALNEAAGEEQSPDLHLIYT
jgi:hypothetical protein